MAKRKQKKVRGLACVYCGEPAETEDHILARGVFHTTPEENARVAPACQRCNNLKSQLEQYVGITLPFASNHPNAVERLSRDGPRQLGGNLRLAREIGGSLKGGWVFNPASQLWQDRGTINIDGQQIADLMCMVARGLLWHESKITLRDDQAVGHVWLPIREADRVFTALFAMRGQHVEITLESGLLHGRGAISTTDPGLSFWRFSLFGGISLGDDRFPGIDANIIGIVTGPQKILRRLGLGVPGDDEAPTSGLNAERDASPWILT